MDMVDMMRTFLKTEHINIRIDSFDGSISAQSLYKICLNLCVANVQASGGTSICLQNV